MNNWYLGWLLVLMAFITGAGMGLFFTRDDFLGGYNSLRRRMVRLGHIALAAMGMMNVLFAVSTPKAIGFPAELASWGLIVGGIAMPLICFLTAWRPGFRHLFFIPVTALFVGVCQTLLNGAP